MAEVTTAAFPRPRRAARAERHLRKLTAVAARLSPAKPVWANLASIPLTVAGLGCVDTGVFLASSVAGWIVTGLSLVLLEHMIADEP